MTQLFVFCLVWFGSANSISKNVPGTPRNLSVQYLGVRYCTRTRTVPLPLFDSVEENPFSHSLSLCGTRVRRSGTGRMRREVKKKVEIKAKVER